MAQNDFQKNQASIVRQSSLKFTQDYQRTIGVPLTLTELVGITNVVCDYCENGWSAEIKKRFEDIDNHLQKKFEE